MKIYLSRASVSMADDVIAPHPREIEVPDGTSIKDIIGIVAHSDYLPSIGGGRATWSVVSNVPLAVIAQQWSEPKTFFMLSMKLLDIQNGVLRLYFNYHAQIDPEITYQILSHFNLKSVFVAT